MGNTPSHIPSYGRASYLSVPVYATSLSYDRQTQVFIPTYNRKLPASEKQHRTVRIGVRGGLPLLEFKTANRVHHLDIFKRLGLVVKTQGNRFAQTAEVVIIDYYRLDGDRLVPRNRVQGAEWQGIKGPGEASGGLRVGDTLYAINHLLVVNRTLGQVLREIHALMSKKEDDTVLLTWKRAKEVNGISWNLEVPMPPPEGIFMQIENEWGAALPNNFASSSVAI
ncbi:unnamed protein product [Albugo candida]|uniref:PDZ domain-containing protein n=1 Tax=Albugo candida TaxID=65357 RepID=A0A024G7H0_9STRA|nr:unnamed protein product [Albugo candida]|eukprot:CCI42266.1 unnamed protein product [Albugo candida]